MVNIPGVVKQRAEKAAAEVAAIDQVDAGLRLEDRVELAMAIDNAIASLSNLRLALVR